MAISAVRIDERIADVEVNDAELIVRLRDGRRLAAPLDWFPRLKAATPEQRANWEVAAAGLGVHWPEIDEDIGVAGLLRAGTSEAA
ncbi:MAG: DUF2442 domain-containing protein [Alphaproteobacteria bacterium]|jgi:hypothetical protein|nr:DUF2442 domain-containing protein [Alphaproteobacteria bacterium]MBU2041953.1 DUF2442 domain-containing protein [Alphaproteobacteria bacterium]MBU2125107.1 DUF2442 domain-containing protein [Alphaproteobacteria bacterium]MBU2207195.1 DUF2442 domain-containing protein [Alphaproteobacteria bacterium]MBU2291423.1 DUF2442 domain-containing protein [Alphaproteobacteria bacterium]